MNEDKSNDIFIFPKWTGVLRPAVAIGALGGLLYATVVVAFGFSPIATDVVYEPVQPLPYSHALHVGHEDVRDQKVGQTFLQPCPLVARRSLVAIGEVDHGDGVLQIGSSDAP